MKNIAIITLLAALLIACADEQNSGFNFKEFWAEFYAQKAAWESLNIDHYRFTLISPPNTSNPLLSTPPLTMTIFPDREPEITLIDRLPATPELIEEFGITRVPTIEASFANIEARVKDNSNSPHFAGYDVIYNKNYHFPEYSGVRWKQGTNGALGASRIRDFEDLRKNR